MADNSQSDTQQTLLSGFHDPEAARRYKNIENATLPFAKILVEKSSLAKLNSEVHVFDLACGTGAVIQELYDAVPKEKWGQLKVLGGDSSPPMLEYLKARGEEQGWTGLTTQVVDGNDIKLPKATYTHIFVSFAIFVMPNALPKLYELLRPGGFIAVTTWAYLPWQPLLARSVSLMKDPPYAPSVADLENKIFAGHNWGDKAYLAQQLQEAGFEKVDTSREKKVGDCGTPKLFMETMQLPIKMVTTFWEELKREGLLEELNEIMLKELAKEAGGEDKSVFMEFDANIGWGWKSG